MSIFLFSMTCLVLGDNLVMLYLVADRNDSANDFVTRYHGLAVGHVTLHVVENAQIDAAHHFALPWVRIELLQEFQIGEAKPDRFDLDENFVRSRCWYRFRPVEGQFIAASELNGVLCGREVGHFLLPLCDF